MNHNPECETSRVPYSTFLETDSANFYSTVTPLTEAAIELVRDQFVLIGYSFDDVTAAVITNA
jgi:hypothetical protein